jgi:hypothetical protein
MSNAPKKRRFSEEADRVSESQGHGHSQSQGRGCIADGCPLAGTMSNSTKGGPFHCWAHDRLLEAYHWPAMTKAINDNLWIFRVAEKVACMSLFDLERKQNDIHAYLRGRGRDDLCRLKNDGEWSDRCAEEPRPYWAIRLRNAAYSVAVAQIDGLLGARAARSGPASAITPCAAIPGRSARLPTARATASNSGTTSSPPQWGVSHLRH